MRIRVVQVTLATALVMGGGWGLYGLLRNPVSQLPGETRPVTGVTTAQQLALPPRPSEDYVGSAVCAECHAELYARYQTHPMGRSLAHVRDASPLEVFGESSAFNAAPLPHVDLTLRYHATRDADTQYHH